MKHRAWHLPLGIICSITVHLLVVLLLNGGGTATKAVPAKSLPVEEAGVEMETYPIFDGGTSAFAPSDH